MALCILRTMDERMLHALESQRDQLHSRWEALLRVEPVTTPLGQPEALKHMIDYTLNTLFAALRTQHAPRRHFRSIAAAASDRKLCPCGRNPLLAYFVAGEQAILEALILAQANLPDCAETRSASLQELKHTLAWVAYREIETFCALCQMRDQAHGTPPATEEHAEASPA